MRRRRQRNPLLGRIVGISILAHVIALPILAQFGAFKKIQEHFIETRLVTLPPPPVEKTKPEVKKTQKAARKPTAVAKKSATTTQRARQAAQKSNFSQPKVVASAGGPGGDNEPTVDANATGKAGELPTEKTDTQPTTEKEPAPQPKPEPKPEPKPAPEVAPAPKTEPKPIAPTPKPEPRREPVLTDAVATSAPAPAIPDDLRAEALDKTFVAEFTVAPDGAPSNIKVAQSTGNEELDRIALDAARQWRFKPATRDGQAVESRIRLHIEFQVS